MENPMVNSISGKKKTLTIIVPYRWLYSTFSPLEAVRVQTDTEGKFTRRADGKVPVQISMQVLGDCRTFR